MSVPRLHSTRFRNALRGEGSESVMEVLTDSFGSKNLARICVSYLADAARVRAESHKIVKWFYFACGVGLTLLFGIAVKVFS